MSTRLPLILLGFAGVSGAGPVGAQEPSVPVDPVSTGVGFGMAIVILLAVLIGLSVVAKLLIVFGVVTYVINKLIP